MSDRYQGTDGIEYREGYNNGRADARAELMPEIEGLRREIDALDAEIERLRALKAPASRQLLNITKALLDLDYANAEIERLRLSVTKGHRQIQDLLSEIERLRAALVDVLPLAERYVGRSDGQPDAIYDRLANARRALEERK